MPHLTTPPKLKFPGMLDAAYRKHHERLGQADAVAKTAAKLAYKAAADRILPSWDRATW